MREKIKLLRNRNIGLVVSGLFVSLMFSSLYGIVTAFYITSTTSIVLLGGYISIPFLVNIFLGPYIGKLCDQISRKKIMIYSDIASGIIMLIVVLLFSIYKNQIVFYFATLAMTIASIFFQYASFGIIKQICKEEELQDMNSLMMITSLFVQTLGFLIGAVIIEYITIEIIIIINAISFMLSAYFENKIDEKNYMVKSTVSKEKIKLLGNFKKFFLQPHMVKLLVITICTSLLYVSNVRILYLYIYTEWGVRVVYSTILIILLIAPLFVSFIKSSKDIIKDLFTYTSIGIVGFILTNIILLFEPNIVLYSIQFILVAIAAIGMAKSSIDTATILHKISDNSNVSSFKALFTTIAHLFTPVYILLYSFILSKGVENIITLSIAISLIAIISLLRLKNSKLRM